MKKIWIVIVVIAILGIGAYLLFGGNNPSSNSQQYQTTNVSGNSNNSALQQIAAKYSGLNLTPGQPQTDAVPPTSSNIPAP